MIDESHWIQRCQTAEAKLNTAQEAYGPAIEKIQHFKSNFGIKERQDGEIVIDFDKFVENLGLKSSLELRAIIDERYNISGEPGKKPRLTIVATSD